MNEVYEYPAFSALLEEYGLVEREWIEGVKDQLRETLHVGDSLRFDWLREKRLKGLRVYYVINESTRKVLLITIGRKKDQQKIIDFIIKNREYYFKYLN